MNAGIQKIDPLASAALIIGCREYPQSDFPAVPAVEGNLVGLYNAFRDPDLWGLEEDQVLQRMDVTGADLLRRASRHAMLADEDGIFVLYFCGHAERHGKNLHLVPSDADRSRPEDSMVPIEKVFAAVDDNQRVAVRRKILILDCCYAGQAIREAPGAPINGSWEEGAGEGWYIMAATSKLAEAIADFEHSASLFTSAILQALQGSAEGPRSLSPRWVFESASALIGKAQQAQQSSASWSDLPWIRNKLFVEKAREPHAFPTQESQSLIFRPRGFGWPAPDPLYIGRAEELERARDRLRPGTVLPVFGPRYAGKNAFVRQLLSSQEVQESGPLGRPWLRFNAVISNASAESPVLEAMAKALEIRLQDVDQESDAGEDTRRLVVVDRLDELTRGHTLLLEIDCERLGYNARTVTSELDRLLGDPYFRDSLSVVISRVDPDVSGLDQLIAEPAVKLEELADDDAAQLLTALAAREHVTVDGDAVMARVKDARLRLPGILSRSAPGLLGRLSPGMSELPPQDAIEALLQRSVRGVANSLLEAGCRLTSSTATPGRRQALPALIAWALADELPLPESLLEGTQTGISRRMWQILEDARVLFRTADGLLEIGQVSKQALRSLLLAVLFRDKVVDDPFAPLPLDRELDELFGPSVDVCTLDDMLSAAAFELLLGAVGAPRSDDEVVRQALRAMQWALGWIEDEGGSRLPQLHKVLQYLLLGHAGDELFLPVNPAETASWAPLAPAVTSEPIMPDQQPGNRNTLATTQHNTVGSLHWLCQAVAQLTLAARATGTLEQVTGGFLAAAREFSAALNACAPEALPPSLMRSADVSLALTGRRLGVTRHLLDIRRDALPKLLPGAESPQPGRVGRISLAISWLLNTADALLDAGAEEDAHDLVNRARSLLDSLPGSSANRQAHIQLRCRVSQMTARCLSRPEQRWEELRVAVEYAVTGLHVAAANDGQELQSVWLRRVLDSALRLVKQSMTDEQVMEAIGMADAALSEAWGDQAGWPINVRLTACRFLRSAHARLGRTDAKLQGARRAVALIAPLLPSANDMTVPNYGQSNVLADMDIARVLVNLAQAEAFQANALRGDGRFGEARSSLAKAEQHAHEAVRVAPSTATYSVWLRQVLDLHRATSRVQPDARKKSDDRRRGCIRAVRDWLADQTELTYWHAALDLRCLTSDWAEQGSLRRACSEPGEDFAFYPPEKKARLIEGIYSQRNGRLKTHRRRYGDSTELCIMETNLEREYQRWKAITNFAIPKRKGKSMPISYPQVDNKPVFAIFERAATLWPSNNRIQEAEAEFCRYIWNDAAAVTAYERLARTASDGETWRRAKVMAAEALLAQVLHQYVEPDRRQKLLQSAQGHLTGLIGHGRYSQLTAVLSNQVALELGKNVEWDRIDEAFESIVGENYTGTVGRFLNQRYYGERMVEPGLSAHASISLSKKPVSAAQQQLREQFGIRLPVTAAQSPGTEGGREQAGGNGSSSEPDQSRPMDIAELLLSDFTSVDLLRSFGQLYLARAESMTRNYNATNESFDIPEARAKIVTRYAQRAYDCFDACRILEEARDGESSVTKFLRGRAITMGSAASKNPDPFSRSDREQNKTMVEMANGLLHAAYLASVGNFHQVCYWYMRQNNRLVKQFGLMSQTS